MTSHYLQPVSGVIGAVGFDGQKNASLEALNAQNKKNESKSSGSGGVRSFNIGCLCLFFMSSVFVFPFFGFINTPQIVFYFMFVAYAIINIVFLSLSPISKENFVKVRYFTVYLPSLILVLLQIAAFVLFLDDLDDINQKLDNMYPVDEGSLLMKQYFVIMNVLLFFLSPLFMSVSFIAITSECLRQMREKCCTEADEKQIYYQNNYA